MYMETDKQNMKIDKKDKETDNQDMKMVKKDIKMDTRSTLNIYFTALRQKDEEIMTTFVEDPKLEDDRRILQENLVAMTLPGLGDALGKKNNPIHPCFSIK
jgi:hypothetical protein